MNNLIELIKSFSLGFAVLFSIAVVIGILALWLMHSPNSFLLIMGSACSAVIATLIGDGIRHR